MPDTVLSPAVTKQIRDVLVQYTMPNTCHITNYTTVDDGMGGTKPGAGTTRTLPCASEPTRMGGSEGAFTLLNEGVKESSIPWTVTLPYEYQDVRTVVSKDDDIDVDVEDDAGNVIDQVHLKVITVLPAQTRQFVVKVLAIYRDR